MFWFDEALIEEEWSLSAKLFAGLVFNPFSMVNANDDSLFAWFWKQITGSTIPNSANWRVKPEYTGSLGRNDWRLHMNNWQIAIECKFGDGIHIQRDCLQYLEGLDPDYHRVVIVASVSELSELTESCLNNTEHTMTLREKLNNSEVVLIAWHEIIEAAQNRLSKEKSQVLRAWADKVKRDSLELMPEKLLSGRRTASLILEGKAADIPITHRPDGRKDRRPTAILKEVCDKQKAPEWVRSYMRAAERMCQDKQMVFESKHSGWVNIRKNLKSKQSATLFPWYNGIAILISHPLKGQKFSGYSSLETLNLHDIVPKNKNWFPRERTIGLKFEDTEKRGEEKFVNKIRDLLKLF